MTDTMNEVLSFADKRNEQISKVIEKLYSAAQPSAVYSEPLVAGNYTVITASEVSAGGGFGSGSGFGPATKPSKKEADGEVAQPESQPDSSGGSGIGGGGGSTGRPVAVIIIGPDGVTIKPVFDVTKVALAGITAWGAMVMMLRKMLNAKRR